MKVSRDAILAQAAPEDREAVLAVLEHLPRLQKLADELVGMDDLADELGVSRAGMRIFARVAAPAGLVEVVGGGIRYLLETE